MNWIDKLVNYAEEECAVHDYTDISTIRNVCEMIDVYGDGYDKIDMLTMALESYFWRDDIVACLGKNFELVED